MQRLALLAALLGGAAARQLAPAPAPSALGALLDASWLPANGRTCAQTCARRGSALSFVSASDGATALCAFTQGGQLSTGSESSAQPGVCQAGAASSSTDFACKCLNRSQLPGLALPLPADATCDRSCAKAMSGVTGTGVRLAAGSDRRVCIAHDDIGSSNRFTATSAGSANAPVTCQAGATTLSGANFSCVCEFTLAPAPAVAVEGDPRVAAQSLATLG